tara:strand:+ start:3824 stop:4498 length:675 start_codon:yes stop_codon:yes gene_type:complete
MAILSKGTTFNSTEQVTSTKLNNLADAATFVSGASGTCVDGGGVEVTSGGQLQVEDASLTLTKFATALKNQLFPIGIICETTEHSSNTAWASAVGIGTWAVYGAGKATVATDGSTFGTPGAIGASDTTTGAETVTLTNAQIPNHTHTGEAYYKIDGGGQTDPTGLTERTFLHENAGHTTTTGSDSSYGRANVLVDTAGGGSAPGGGSHTNIQPSIVVYRYRRTA